MRLAYKEKTLSLLQSKQAHYPSGLPCSLLRGSLTQKTRCWWMGASMGAFIYWRQAPAPSRGFLLLSRRAQTGLRLRMPPTHSDARAAGSWLVLAGGGGGEGGGGRWGGGKREKSHSAFSAPLSARGEERMKPGGLVARTGPSTEEGRKDVAAP